MNERLERFSVPVRGGAERLDVEVVVRDSGRGDTTVLCLHGFGDNLHTWQAVRAMLEPLGARLVAVDLPGLGRSPLPRGFGRAYLWNAVALAAEMTARWRSADARLFVMGNSLGGALALALAVREAGAGRALDGLLLLAPATPATRLPVFAHLARSPLYRWSGGLQRRLPRRARRAAGILVARASLQLILSPGFRAPRAWRDSIIDSFSRPGCFDDIERIARDVLWILGGKDPAVTPLFDGLPDVSTPAVVLHGDADRVVRRREMVTLCERLPHARLLALPGVGHCPQIEAPARCAEAYRELLSEAPA